MSEGKVGDVSAEPITAGDEGPGDAATPERSSSWPARFIVIALLVLLAVLLGFTWGMWVRSIPNFLREAAVLISVFPILDRHLQHQQLTVRYCVAAVLLGLLMLLAGDFIESRLQLGDSRATATAPATSR